MDGVVGVAEWVPSRLVGLGVPAQVGGPGPDGDVAGPGEAGGKLPRLPAVPAVFTGQRGRPPGGVVDAHLDAGDGRGSLRWQLARFSYLVFEVSALPAG